MFKLSSTFRWNVQFHYASMAGELEPQAFTAKFRRLTAKEFSEFDAKIAEAARASDNARALALRSELLDRVFADFEDVEFDEGLQSREDVKAALIDDATVARALVEAYSEAMAGIREKNSEGPRSDSSD